MVVVRVGIIGCGGVTVLRHLPALSRAHEVRVAALCDSESTRLQRAASQFKIGKTFLSADELIRCAEVDAVAVCTPPATHAELACAVLQSRKHLFLEKPIAATPADADRIIAAAAGSGVTAMVDFNLRSHRLVQEASSLLQQGRIGEVRMVQSTYASSTRTNPETTSWRLNPSLGGLLQEQAIHHFDLWRHLLKSEIVEIDLRASEGMPEAVCTALTDRGVLIHAGFSEHTTEICELDVFGDAGVLRLSCYAFDGLEIIPKGVQVGGLPRRLKRMASSLGSLPLIISSLTEGGEYVATYRRRWEHFRECIAGSSVVNGTLEDGRKALQLVLAARQSAAEKRPVKVA